MKLKDKIALIPGGTSGIGLCIAKGFIREGATVVAAGLPNSVEAAQAELEALGNKGYVVGCDISDPDQVFALVNQVKERYGRIDILLNSAGAFPHVKFLDMTIDQWKGIIDLNLNGSFYCAKAVAPIMAEQNHGRIIFITSAKGLRGISGNAHYAASKGGVISLARALASELGPYHITVNTIAAGLTLTGPTLNSMTPDKIAFVAAKIPNKRLAEPDDYTEMAIFMASDASRHMTGQTVAIDGGDSTVEVAKG